MNSDIKLPNVNVPTPVIRLTEKFLEQFRPYELAMDSKLCLYFDRKSNAFYIACHLEGRTLAQMCDSNATLDPGEEDELFKLNREITEDQAAFKLMAEDAAAGRSFEDLVLEFDPRYGKQKPLKVYGGQHRLAAISKSQPLQQHILHGVRVYFNLSREQKVEIATVNNTAIAVPNDLLDRMREQLLGNELRNWCQHVGLLEEGIDFADRRSPEIPTVRIARTLLVNYYLGKAHQIDTSSCEPVICKSGGIDDDYMKIRDTIVWDDPRLVEMGKEFARLHHRQREAVVNRADDNNAEFARKALSLAVVASWSYAAGLFQHNKDFLKTLYALPDNVVPPDDPLNAKALSLARLKGTDPDTYRGLGARTSPKELGRMLEVFIVLAKKSKKKITKEIANAAIQAFEAKRAVLEANRKLERI